jgi:hypothetical protein
MKNIKKIPAAGEIGNHATSRKRVCGTVQERRKSCSCTAVVVRGVFVAKKLLNDEKVMHTISCCRKSDPGK